MMPLCKYLVVPLLPLYYVHRLNHASPLLHLDEELCDVMKRISKLTPPICVILIGRS